MKHLRDIGFESLNFEISVFKDKENIYIDLKDFETGEVIQGISIKQTNFTNSREA